MILFSREAVYGWIAVGLMRRRRDRERDLQLLYGKSSPCSDIMH
jgi:hypothetical protein